MRLGLGLCTAIDMIKGGHGRNFIIVEKGTQVGGTWNENIYPGCCCDGTVFPGFESNHLTIPRNHH